MRNWLYKGKAIQPGELEGKKAFVYLITNKKTGRKYYGKKRLQFTRTRKKPGKIRRTKTVKESNWRDYWGSSKELLADIEKYGEASFIREIVRICTTLGEASYYEAKLQFQHDVILYPDKFYNTFVGCRIHAKHLKINKYN